jgi:hypothetical protein
MFQHRTHCSIKQLVFAMCSTATEPWHKSHVIGRYPVDERVAREVTESPSPLFCFFRIIRSLKSSVTKDQRKWAADAATPRLPAGTFAR